jgi:hypothetical protein
MVETDKIVEIIKEEYVVLPCGLVKKRHIVISVVVGTIIGVLFYRRWMR